MADLLGNPYAERRTDGLNRVAVGVFIGR